MTNLCESSFLDGIYVRDVRVISGVRPRGRIVDKTADGRHESGLVYIWNGETVFRDGGSLTVAHPGDLIYIPKGKKYKMEYTVDGTTFVLVNFNTCRTSGENALLFDGITRVARDDGECTVARVMTSLELCAASMDASAIFRRKELLYRLLGIIFGSSHSIEPCTREGIKGVDGAVLIEKTYLENIPISELAEACHVSENTFRSLFRKKYKTSPVQYRNRLRIARARELLSEGSCTVAEAAWESGFDNIGYFSRLYKRTVGESPSETRRKSAQG